MNSSEDSPQGIRGGQRWWYFSKSRLKQNVSIAFCVKKKKRSEFMITSVLYHTSKLIPIIFMCVQKS